MAIHDIADQYFTYENRLASFQVAHPLPKRRASGANSKAPKSMKWPHKNLLPRNLAKAGFFYHPTADNPDNVACFLCHRALDGWDEDDDPLAEHIKHSPNCGWAIVATVEAQFGELSQEHPLSKTMIDARKATFANQWPHESKKGWKCKVKQLVDAGWRYAPTNEYEDMATCDYCELSLDGWENTDKPMDEHYKRSPDCAFFTLINDAPPPKKTKAKRGSKASRLSTQSQLTVASEGPSFIDLPVDEGDSVLTTDTNATAKRMGKVKKAPAKARVTRAKKEEPVEAVADPEPEDDDFEVKVAQPPAPKPAKGRKRKSEQEAEPSILDIAPPPAKRRTTRTRGSIAVDVSDVMTDDEPSQLISKPKGRKDRGSTKMTRKASNTSIAPIRAPIPNDDEIDAALRADLERPLSEDDAQPTEPNPVPKKNIRGNKASKSEHSMFVVEPMEIDEAVIEAELEAMEVESKPIPKAKGAKGKQPRKVSAKQQAAAKKAAELQDLAEAEAAAQAKAEAEKNEEDEASLQIAGELENSISTVHSSSEAIESKPRRVSNRQTARQLPGRATRGSTMATAARIGPSVNSSTLNQESGDESDASNASQSTVVRGGSTRRGSTMKNGKGGKKATSRNIEEIVNTTKRATSSVEPEVVIPSAAKGKANLYADRSMTEDAFYTPAPEFMDPMEAMNLDDEDLAQSTPKPGVPNSERRSSTRTKSSTLLQEESPEESPEEVELGVEEIEESIVAKEVAEPTPKPSKSKTKTRVVIESPRVVTPVARETTPSQSPQSSDAENHPPSSKPSAPRAVATPSTARRVPLAAMTPSMSPSKRNIIAGLQTLHPWTGVDIDTIFTHTPGGKNVIVNTSELFGEEMAKAGKLTSPEKNMTVEQWIKHNAEMAEGRLKRECETMVSGFESLGTRAMMALEGIECQE